ncbi:MAG: rod shape-determining protein MreD [Sulfitobacter sp.]
MNDQSPALLWAMRLAFVLLVFVILFFHLLPLDTQPIDLFTPQLLPLENTAPAEARLEELLGTEQPRRWIAPDLILCFACAWALRRPEYVPALSLALVFLFADLLLQRPPGLWALLALIGCENLKSRARSLRDANFVAEWLTVGVIMIAITLLNHIVLALVLVETPKLALSLSELAMTLLFYPVTVLITHSLMRVRKTAPGDLDALGQRV